MSLMDLITAAVQHHEKEPLAWMILHSLYQARIVSHANTGEDVLASSAGVRASSEANVCSGS